MHMNTLAYALATALLLAFVPGVAADEPAPSQEPTDDETPCNAFYYTLDPPDVAIRLRCLFRDPL